MKIRTQLMISIVLFGIALLIVAGSIIMTNQQVEKINRQQDLVNNIEIGAGELGYLSNDYLLYNESQQLGRWNTKYAEFSSGVSNLSANTPEQQALVDTIKASNLRLKEVFSNVVSTLNDESLASNNSADKAYIQVSWNRLAVQTRGIIFDASRLSQLLQDQENQAKQTNNLLIIALLGAFGAFILIDYLLVFGGAIKSISNLREGTKIIGSGNLDYSIKAKRGDEVGELADAFNQMTARLKTVTASKADLEREVEDRKRTEGALRKSEEKFRLLADYTYDWETWTDQTGNYIYVSPSCERITGHGADEFYKDKEMLLKLIHPDDLADYQQHYQLHLHNSSDSSNIEFRILTAGGETRWISHACLPVFGNDGVWQGRRASNRDITERKRNEDEREITVEFLRIVNESTALGDLIRAVTTFVQSRSGCEAVGIRLRHEYDYPYYETRGFSNQFILAETHLCLRDNSGQPVCDRAGNPILECMCGNVIRGRFDPSKPFFTARGSFWTNNTTKLLATTSEADRRARTRNRCNGEGYESVAVIALRMGTDCLGLLQMNTRRIGQFTPESIAMWERLADYLAVAVAKFETEESIHRQAELIDLSPDGILIRKPDGTITYWAHGAEVLYGYKSTDAIGHASDLLLKTSYPEPADDIFMKLKESGRWTGELIHTAKDGRQIVVQSRWLARLDGQGNIAEILESNVDITERKRAEMVKEQLLARLKAKTGELQDVNEEIEVKNEELAAQSEELECANEELRTHNEELQSVSRSLRETQDYLENLINYANAPIIVWDPAFIVTRFNRAFEWLSGYTASEVLGKNLSLLFPPDSRVESLEKIKKTLEGEQWESVEIPILHKYGSIRIALWNSANIYDDNNCLVATIAQGQDITRRKQVEKDLEDAKSQAELYLDLMGHDISNMHQIIMMQLELAAEILKAEGKLQGEDRELIDSSLQTLDKAARLINNVRKLQKHQTGEYSLESVDLNLIIEEVLKEYSNLPGKDVKLKFAPDGRSLVQANPLLKDVFSNIVDNAVKHSGSPLMLAISIGKVSKNGSSFYRVAIEDNGAGIPDDKKDEVFFRFRRGQTKAKGTGLGLYIVKTLVESFGGYVEIQNRVLDDYTQGTRFLVYLPAMEE